MCKSVHKICLRLLAAVILVLAASSCGDSIRNIQITSVQLESYKITSSSTMEATFLVEVSNPAKDLKISDLSAVLKYDGEAILNATAPDVELEGASTAEYRLPCEASLAENVSLLKAGMLLANLDTDKLKADLSLGITPQGGHLKKLNFKDLDIASLLKQE